MIDVMKYANYHLDDEDCFDIPNLIELLNQRRLENICLYNNMIKNLNAHGYYPVYDMPGHRGTHYFPTELECEMWEDWLKEKKENG